MLPEVVEKFGWSNRRTPEQIAKRSNACRRLPVNQNADGSAAHSSEPLALDRFAIGKLSFFCSGPGLPRIAKYSGAAGSAAKKAARRSKWAASRAGHQSRKLARHLLRQDGWKLQIVKRRQRAFRRSGYRPHLDCGTQLRLAWPQSAIEQGLRVLRAEL